MRHRILAGSAIVMLLLGGLVAPAGAVATSPGSVSIASSAVTPAAQAKRNKYRICDAWDGIWSISVDDGNGNTNYGQMDVRVFHHERAVGDYGTGPAGGQTTGKMKGDLTDRDGDPKTCGKRWEGRFHDQAGQYRNKGKFWAQLYKENGVWYFYGEYKPCRVLCSWINWGGVFQSED